MCDKGEKGLHGVIHIKCGDVVGKWDLQEFERELAEAGVKKMEMGSFKIPVIKMSDVPNLAKEMEKVKRIMISQPMSGKSFYEIKETRFKAMDKLEKEGFEIVNSFFTEEWIALNAGGIKNKNLWCLAKSLEVLASCDAVYFCAGWENARGCRIEHEAAVNYGLEVMYEE